MSNDVNAPANDVICKPYASAPYSIHHLPHTMRHVPCPYTIHHTRYTIGHTPSCCDTLCTIHTHTLITHTPIVLCRSCQNKIEPTLLSMATAAITAIMCRNGRTEWKPEIHAINCIPALKKHPSDTSPKSLKFLFSSTIMWQKPQSA